MASVYMKLFDGRKFDAFLRKSEDGAQKLLDKVVNIIKDYDERYLLEGDLAIENVVEMFYDDYTPIAYDRQEDLYNAYEVSIEDGEWAYDFGAHLMQKEHHGPNEYIYDNSFVEGYHGGDRYGDDHPQPGVPWWKALPTLDYWSRPAEKFDGSPYFMAKTEIEKLIDLLSEQKYNEGHSAIVSFYNDWYASLLSVFKI